MDHRTNFTYAQPSTKCKEHADVLTHDSREREEFVDVDSSQNDFHLGDPASFRISGNVLSNRRAKKTEEKIDQKQEHESRYVVEPVFKH